MPTTLLELGVTGPLLRAAGVPWDLRKSDPYSSYEDFEFTVPIGTIGDNYDRFAVRLREMRQSVRIIEQAIDGLPEGPWITEDRKVALPPRHELATSMEALIHHFKLVTEGFRVPPGEVYFPIEGPRGELGCFVRSDGSSKPARVHMRDPSFVNLQATAADGQGQLHRRPDRHAGDARPGARRHRPLSADELATQVPRFAHGSRVPGWDAAADLSKDPAGVPDPATTPVPDELRAEIEGHMAKYPDRRSAAIPALAAVQARYGWCTPEGVDQAACVMRLTPGYLMAVATFYDMLETEPVGRHALYVCTNITCSLLGADELLARIEAEVGGDPDFNVRGFECLGACDIAPMASVDGVYVGPIALDDVPELIGQIKSGEAPLPAKQLAKRASVDPGAVRTSTPSEAPLPPEPSAFGPPMTGDAGEQVAPQEQPPDQPEGEPQS